MNCENCGKYYIKPIYGSGRFCCGSCRCAYTNKHRKISNETKEKISESLKRYYNIKNDIKIKKYFCGTLQLNNENPEISKHQSSKWFNKLIPFGLNINTLYTKKFVDEYNKVKDLLYTEYVINQLSPKDIYIKYNCKKYINNSETLLHLFKSYNFPIRHFSESTTVSYLHGKLKGPTHTLGKDCYHITWNNKKVYLRSTYELDYALYLDSKQIDYDVECKRIKYYDSIKQKYRCAIPDFYISNKNLLVEVKSNYTLDIQNMKDKFNEYIKLGYNVKLILEHKETDLYKL